MNQQRLRIINKFMKLCKSEDIYDFSLTEYSERLCFDLDLKIPKIGQETKK